MPQTVNIKITVDLKYIDWSNPAVPTGQLQWDVDPTLLVIPTDDCTLKFDLNEKDANGASVVFASTSLNGVEGIVWKNTGSNPGAPSRVDNTTYQVVFDNSNSTSTTDWGYTVNVVVTKGSFSKVLSYDPDVENESPTNL